MDWIEHWGGLVQGVFLADLSGRLQAIGSGVWSIFQVLLGLGFVIFVHELGHFLAAKFFGVKCEKFYVGFDVPIKIGPIRLPSKLAKFQWGETEYGIGIIPLGGYVKMLGQDDDPRKAEEEMKRIRRDSEDDGGGSSDRPPKLDARSYPAKPVFARMVIISAGVVMNIVFAAILAGGAFLIGVPYVPAVVGSVTPGDPAWAAGVQPGDKVMQFGLMTQPNPKMYFDDIRESMMLATLDDPTRTIPIVVERGSETKSFRVVGTPHDDGSKDKRFVVGVVPAESTTISQVVSIAKDIELARSGLQGGDRIVAVQGEDLPKHATIDNFSFVDFLARSEVAPDRPLEVTVERKSSGTSERFNVSLPPLSLKTLGFGLALGPIHAVQADSPAAAAGIRAGDQIMEVNGQTVLDSLTLHLDIARMSGREAHLVVLRSAESGDERLELTWRVPEAFFPNNFSNAPGLHAFELPGSGIAYSVSPIVSRVDADIADGLQVGDELRQFQILADATMQQELEQLLSPEAFKETAFVGSKNPIMLQQLIQSLPANVEIRLDVMRQNVVANATVRVTASKQHYWPGRGLVFRAAQLTHRADTLTEALSLGVRETKRRLGDVLTFLRLAFTGKISARAVGGPLVIFAVASDQASQGISKLLMFLTLLSANLAILNFLPIPALDGGHMMFLTMEAVLRRPLDEKLQASASMIGVLALLALMIFVIINDVLRLASFG